MKKLITLLFVVPFMLKGQTEYRHFCSFDAETTAKHVMMKHVKQYLSDTVEFSVEKRGFKYNKKYVNANQAEKKILKTLKKGMSCYSSKTNAGYTFVIAVLSKVDDTEVLNYIKFDVDHFSQKITSVEISKGI